MFLHVEEGYRSLVAGRSRERYRSGILLVIGLVGRIMSWKRRPGLRLREPNGIAGRTTGIRRGSGAAWMTMRPRMATWHAHRGGRGGETGK